MDCNQSLFPVWHTLSCSFFAKCLSVERYYSYHKEHQQWGHTSCQLLSSIRSGRWRWRQRFFLFKPFTAWQGFAASALVGSFIGAIDICEFSWLNIADDTLIGLHIIKCYTTMTLKYIIWNNSPFTYIESDFVDLPHLEHSVESIFAIMMHHQLHPATLLLFQHSIPQCSKSGWYYAHH